MTEKGLIAFWGCLISSSVYNCAGPDVKQAAMWSTIWLAFAVLVGVTDLILQSRK